MKFVLAFVIQSVYSFVVRLDCRYEAVFDIVLTDTYVQGSLLKTVESTDQEKCILNCITTNNCEFVNFAQNQKICELFSGLSDATSVSRVGSTFLSTNYTSKNMGQACRQDPCNLDQSCIASCHTEEYYCEGRVNVALGKTATCEYGTPVPDQLFTDGYLINSARCDQPSVWLLIDLERSVLVEYLGVVNLSQQPTSDYLFGFSIGDVVRDYLANTLCAKHHFYTVTSKPVFCEGPIPGQVKYLRGRYVYMFYANTRPENYLYNVEIMVFEKS